MNVREVYERVKRHASPGLRVNVYESCFDSHFDGSASKYCILEIQGDGVSMKIKGETASEVWERFERQASPAGGLAVRR